MCMRGPAGFVPQATIPSGIHTKMLFSSVHRFSLKTQLMELTLNVPTNEGLIVELDGGYPSCTNHMQ